MAYSKTKLKSNGNKRSPSFKRFLIGNMLHKCLSTRTLIYVSVRHIFISLTSFMGIAITLRILYKTSVLIESYAFLKPINSWHTDLLCFHFYQFFDECRIHDQWLTFCVEIHTDEPQKVPRLVELTLTAGCCIKFCT